MPSKSSKKIIIAIIAILVVISGLSLTSLWLNFNKNAEGIAPSNEQDDRLSKLGIKTMTKELFFSEPTVKELDDFSCVYVNESTVYNINIGRPVLPSNISVIEFPFGTKIINVSFSCSQPEPIEIKKKISFGSYVLEAKADKTIYDSNAVYPEEYVTYHTAGGLSNGIHKTFLVIKVNPIRYIPSENQLQFFQHFTIHIKYKEPTKNILDNASVYKLLIIAPTSFTRLLQPLVKHKNTMGMKTVLVNLDDVYKKGWKGRDQPEKIKYFIKKAIEDWGIKYVILVGGMKGLSTKWYLPIRYSHVIIPEGTQEIIEPEFISDLYYADIYDSEGNFSSWDSNKNNIFAEWDGTTKDDMDLYPDVYLGRLACRNKIEVKTMVKKIISYEKNTADDEWFKRIIMVSGDHWKDPDHVNEGSLIMEEAAQIMSDLTPIKLIATEENTLLVRDITKALNNGAGFAYFCGHGGSSAWGIHYPPDAEGWAPTLTKSRAVPFYLTIYMNFLRNKNKLPVVVVGGCLNAKFDISVATELKAGKINVMTNCWAWKLTSTRGGGSIATIANTGLGTHAMGDSDQNSKNDYLEILDGWMELRFLEMYATEHKEILGQNYGQTMTEYLHRFYGNNDEMDTKMVQQWQLFGDPSLKIGGYG
jgi:hypothetical protein